jgi:hypothetical protein
METKIEESKVNISINRYILKVLSFITPKTIQNRLRTGLFLNYYQFIIYFREASD